MEFELSETQRMMQQAARSFLGGRCPSERVRKLMATDTAFDPELWQAMAEQGWCGMTLPETVGGLDLGVVEVAAVAEEMGRACLPGPWLSNLHASTLLASVFSQNAWIEAFLTKLAAGESRAAIALLEDERDPTLDEVTLAADRTGDDIQLSGRKTCVCDAATADLLIVAARLGDEPALFAVDQGARALTIRPTPAVDATRKLYEVAFDDVRIPPDRCIAVGDAARQAIEETTHTATVALCAEMVGGMQWVLETAVEYAKTRKQFNRVIGSFQAVQHQCADMLLLLESSRSATYFAAWALSENEPNAAEAVSIAKAYVSDAVREVGNRGVQVHGGIGFTWEHDLQLYYKRFTASEYALGDATYHRRLLAEQVKMAIA